MRRPICLFACLGRLAPLSIAAYAAEVDTQFIFGFTLGADVGETGEKEIEHVTLIRAGKADGSYSALTDQLRAEFTPVENFRVEIAVPFSYFNISGVTGLDDRRFGAFDGLSMELRYRLIDREHAPFAVTIGAEPHWSRTDEIGGDAVDAYGSEFAVTLDREFVENRIYGVFSLFMGPMRRSRASPARGCATRPSAYRRLLQTSFARGCSSESRRAICESMTASGSILLPAKRS